MKKIFLIICLSFLACNDDNYHIEITKKFENGKSEMSRTEIDATSDSSAYFIGYLKFRAEQKGFQKSIDSLPLLKNKLSTPVSFKIFNPKNQNLTQLLSSDFIKNAHEKVDIQLTN